MAGALVTSRKSLTLLLLLGSWPATAEAYCRTRTCDVDLSCEQDDDYCSAGGKAAYWANGCLTFALQRDGSKLQDISSRDALEVVEDAFALWTDSECHRGGSPPLTFLAQDEVSCHVPEFNCDPKDWNANVIMFQDQGWPHGAGALAITCVTMNLDTGEILDADMELNTTDWDFALPGDAEGTDLHMVITHEAGHFLGLNHSRLHGSVMFQSHQEDVLLSSLSDDDIAGICEMYGGKENDPQCKAPAELPSDTDCVGASECVPTANDSEGCSCREGAPTGSGGSGALVGLIAGVAAIARRRRFV